MPIENLRLRAMEALRTLREAQLTTVPSEFKVGPLCDAMQAVRDLLLCYGDKHSLVPGDHQEAKSFAVLKVLGTEVHSLISALEIVSSRSQGIVELNDGSDGHSKMDGHRDGKDGHRDGRSPSDGNGAQ